MEKEHELNRKIAAAQEDSSAADEFIAQYMPFVKSETAKFIGHNPVAGQDEELSVALFAFYEALIAYRPGKGSFFRLAALSIRNRLIDHNRREMKHRGTLSYDAPAGDDEEGNPIIDSMSDGTDHAEEISVREATKEEIAEFTEQLSEYGLALSDIADACPKQQRTLNACIDVLNSARQNPELLQRMTETKKLPIAALAKESGVDAKTLERHRKYLIGILLAFTNGFEIIRGHLCRMRKMEVQKA